MSVARRCSLCSTEWPDDKLYKICPECEEETSRFKGADPIEDDEAFYRKTNAEFERFYERWDDQHDAKRLKPTRDDDRLYGKSAVPRVR